MADIPRWLIRLLDRPSAFWPGQVGALICVGVAGLLRVLAEPLVTGVPFITFFPAVAVATLCCGYRAGLTAIAGSMVLAGWLWFPQDFGTIWSLRSLSALVLFLLMSGLVVLLVQLLRALVLAVRRAEDRAELTAREMRHRFANLITLIQSISSLTARTAADPEEYRQKFEARLLALARAQDLALPDSELPTELGSLLTRMLAPFDLARFRMAGPATGLDNDTAAKLALVLHELATNATKYGALSVPEGYVELTWQPSGPSLVMTWRECGGPAVGPPARIGFGSRLIGSAFAKDGDGVTVDYAVDGLRCSVSFPGTVAPGSATPSTEARALAS